MTYNSKWENISMLISMAIVCATIITIVIVIGYYLNQGAIRENKLATECVQAGGTWRHGDENSDSICVWGRDAG